MKRNLLFLFGFLYFSNISAQYADSLTNSEVSVLLEKAKKQKKTAWTLFGIGVGASVVGSIVFTASLEDAWDSGDGSRLAQGLILATAGGLCLWGSLPFFIASGKNKRKAAALVSIKMENSSYVSQYSITEIKYPAITLTVNF